MSTTFDSQRVREIARTAVSYAIRDQLVQRAMVEHGVSADNVYAWSETYDAVLDAIAAGVQEPAKQPEFECEVCTQPITAYPCVLCEHEPDPWNRCGRLCTEMHTYEPGQCKLAPQEAEQPQDDGNARVVAPMSDVRLERLAGLAGLPCTCQDVDCGNYTSALTAQEARELVAEAKRARAALEARDAKAGA